jgi:hypothetical protein
LAWNQWTEFAVSYASAGEVLIQARNSDVRVYGRVQKARDKKDKNAGVEKMVEADRDRDVNGAPVGNGNGTLTQDQQPDRGELLRAGQEMRRPMAWPSGSTPRRISTRTRSHRTMASSARRLGRRSTTLSTRWSNIPSGQ